MEERRTVPPDRRARRRGGRRDGDERKPWYTRRRLWLGAASVLFVVWRRLRHLGGRRPDAIDRQRAA